MFQGAVNYTRKVGAAHDHLRQRTEYILGPNSSKLLQTSPNNSKSGKMVACEVKWHACWVVKSVVALLSVLVHGF